MQHTPWMVRGKPNSQQDYTFTNPVSILSSKLSATP
jgi:hypothetical protein